ncbi:hypothetical protein J4U01_gp076 [Mycobacterium phage Kumao]|uniref:Uncharacterized protein n=1 Tax=Mycobacterium phage Kumao TaxID=2041344 RepID=A0A2D1GPR6_9CAUD|nr:hypothetical protein J4U01_gp076 [Mycobacterium phage Kumao]ATN94039.1 hypothetical protein SEA_KUMAO_76 [Mycobacterium phage Kumao]
MCAYENARDFIKARLAQGDTRPALADAITVLIERAELWRKGAEFPDFDGGYASGCEDAVMTMAAVWRHHPDYNPNWS